MSRVSRRRRVVTAKIEPPTIPRHDPFHYPARGLSRVAQHDDVPRSQSTPGTHSEDLVALDEGGSHRDAFDHDVSNNTVPAGHD